MRSVAIRIGSGMKRKPRAVTGQTSPPMPGPARKVAKITTSKAMAPHPIHLSQHELRLRNLLVDVAANIDKTCSAGEPTILRWAGGWVRDKLLGIDTHDIDVAINSMTGESFAMHIREYCESSQAIEKHGLEHKDIGNLHKVARNPDKSKHLETAMVKMFGLDLDFVNLRKETYTKDSRNPEVQFGTAEEDAFRRDATVNSLFYNIHNDKVEDYTGGLADLESKIIRTPLEPLQTFTDDPLRVLRLIRFASRLSFRIDNETTSFMAHPDVIKSLRVKISRERVGVELEKMLKGKHPRASLELIDQLGLYHAIFTDPTQSNITLPDISQWHIAYELLDEVSRDHRQSSIGEVLVQPDDGAYYAWNVAAVAPWMCLPTTQLSQGKSNTPPTVATIARQGFKSPNKLSELIAASYLHLREVLAFKTAWVAQPSQPLQRDTVGMAIRRWNSHGGYWRIQVLNAMLVEAMETLSEWSAENKACISFRTEWENFLEHLSLLDVFKVASIKRLVDGNELARRLEVKPGKWTGKALDICMAWQLRHPHETDPAGAIHEVRERASELGISLK